MNKSIKNKILNSQYRKLEKYKWGFGIEHEMHIFHQPTENSKVENVLLFDSEKYAMYLIDLYEKNNNSGKIRLTEEEYKFLKTIPFELSGRKCSGETVIKKVPFKMPEFVTFLPFCSIKEDRFIENFCFEIRFLKQKYIEILMRIPEVRDLVKKYGTLIEHPFGMTRYLTVPKGIKNGKYILPMKVEENGSKKQIVRQEYNGSYHITMTLPYTDQVSDKTFIKMHQNFANQLQWLEPLMLSSYFTGDEYSPGSSKKRVRGSYRVMIIGWGNLAGSDVRLFQKGIGRYAKTPTYWREGFELEDSDKLKPCYPPSPLALQEDAITSLSSDFRTFGSRNPLRPEHRESGLGMTKPNGVEFRIFDHFPDKYIGNLVYLVGLVAENSRKKQTSEYVYKNKYWIEAVQQVMTYGYRTLLNKEYVKLLRKHLSLKIQTKSLVAIDVFKKIFEELVIKNSNGEWFKIFLGKKKYIKNKMYSSWIKKYILEYHNVPDINKKGYQMAFSMKMNRTDNKNKFSELCKEINNFNNNFNNNSKKVSLNHFEDIVVKNMGKSWKEDVVDIAYLLETYLQIKLIKNNDGTIEFLKFNKELPSKIDWNNIILNSFKISKSNELKNIIKNYF